MKKFYILLFLIVIGICLINLIFAHYFIKDSFTTICETKSYTIRLSNEELKIMNLKDEKIVHITPFEKNIIFILMKKNVNRDKHEYGNYVTKMIKKYGDNLITTTYEYGGSFQYDVGYTTPLLLMLFFYIRNVYFFFFLLWIAIIILINYDRKKMFSQISIYNGFWILVLFNVLLLICLYVQNKCILNCEKDYKTIPLVFIFIAVLVVLKLFSCTNIRLYLMYIPASILNIVLIKSFADIENGKSHKLVGILMEIKNRFFIFQVIPFHYKVFYFHLIFFLSFAIYFTFIHLMGKCNISKLWDLYFGFLSAMVFCILYI